MALEKIPGKVINQEGADQVDQGVEKMKPEGAYPPMSNSAYRWTSGTGGCRKAHLRARPARSG
jgi:hypothetical protein